MRRSDAPWQPPPEWFASPSAGHAVTGIGEIEQDDFGAGVVRQAGWRRVVGLLVVLAMLLPIVGATVLLISGLR
jgi:hypothetical protein